MAARAAPSPGSLAVTAAFLVVAAVLLASIGYAVWIVARYWDAIGV